MLTKKIQNLIIENNYDFYHLKSTSSTMDAAERFLKKNEKNCIILSDKQKCGRGRRGNYWHSPVGNLYCSISLNNYLNIKDHFLYSILICLSIKMTLKKFSKKNIQFKWPNDIFYNNKKFAGMISKFYNLHKVNSHIIVGFGININSSPKIDKYPTTFIKSFTNIKDVNQFFINFLVIFFNNLLIFKNKNKGKLINNYMESLMFLNEKIKISLPDNSTLSGIFKGINNDGSMKLKNNSKLKNIYNATIIL